MGLEEKYKINKNIAYKLLEYNFFDASINRFYYSCFQKLLNYAEQRFEYKDAGEGSSHNNLIKFIDVEINKSMMHDNKKNLIKAKGITGNFKKLKQMRVIADYKSESISEKDIPHVKSLVHGFDEKFGVVKNNM